MTASWGGGGAEEADRGQEMPGSVRLTWNAHASPCSLQNSFAMLILKRVPEHAVTVKRATPPQPMLTKPLTPICPLLVGAVQSSAAGGGRRCLRAAAERAARHGAALSARGPQTDRPLYRPLTREPTPRHHGRRLDGPTGGGGGGTGAMSGTGLWTRVARMTVESRPKSLGTGTALWPIALAAEVPRKIGESVLLHSFVSVY